MGSGGMIVSSGMLTGVDKGHKGPGSAQDCADTVIVKVLGQGGAAAEWR